MQLEQLLSSGCLAPDAHLELVSMSIDARGADAADPHLFSRLCNSLQQHTISLRNSYYSVPIPGMLQLDIWCGHLVEGVLPSVQQQVAGVLGVLSGVMLPPELQDRLCEEAYAAQAAQAAQGMSAAAAEQLPAPSQQGGGS